MIITSDLKCYSVVLHFAVHLICDRTLSILIHTAVSTGRLRLKSMSSFIVTLTHFTVYWTLSAVITCLTYTLYCTWNTPSIDTDGGLKLQLPCLWCAACVDNVSELEHQGPRLVPMQTRPLDSLMDGLWDNGPLGVHTLSAVARWPHRYTDLLFPSVDL